MPHLETNFVCANTLMKLNRPKQGKFMPVGFEKLKGELLYLYKKQFSIRTRQEKKHIQEKAMKIREQIKEMLKKSGWSNDEAKKIANFDIFDQFEQADWFDSEWMFGVNNFDIVIGNPPYVRQEKLKDKKDTFITSNKWMRAKYGKQLRNFLKENVIIEYIIDFAGYKVFESATVDTSIIILKKSQRKNQSIKVAVLDQEVDEGKIKEIISSKMFYINQNKLSDEAYVLGDEEILKLKEKLERVGKPLRDWNVKIYRGILAGLNEAFIIDSKKRQEILDNCKDDEERKRTEKIIKPVLRGRDIGRYYYKWANLWVI